MSTPPGEVKFSKDEMEKIVSYILYKEQIERNASISNAEIWHIGSETMPRLGIVLEIFNYRTNLPDKMKGYEGIPENVKLEDALKRFLNKLIEKAKSQVKNKSAYVRLFFNKFPTREFMTTTI